jgi:hypothetical protein
MQNAGLELDHDSTIHRCDASAKSSKSKRNNRGRGCQFSSLLRSSSSSTTSLVRLCASESPRLRVSRYASPTVVQRNVLRYSMAKNGRGRCSFEEDGWMSTAARGESKMKREEGESKLRSRTQKGHRTGVIRENGSREMGSGKRGLARGRKTF